MSENENGTNETMLAAKQIMTPAGRIDLSLVKNTSTGHPFYVIRAQEALSLEETQMHMAGAPEPLALNADNAIKTIASELKKGKFLPHNTTETYGHGGDTDEGVTAWISNHDRRIFLNQKSENELTAAFETAVGLPVEQLIYPSSRLKAELAEKMAAILEAAGTPIDKVTETANQLATVAEAHFALHVGRSI